MKECNVKDTTIYYDEYGSGRPILFLHGSPVDHRHIMVAFEPLFTQREGWRRIYPDLPGMGKTRAPDRISNQDEVLEIVLEFMDMIAPGEQFVIAGISYGAYLGRGIVHQRFSQVDGMAMIVPEVETDPAKKNLPEHRVIKEDREFLAALRPDELQLANRLVAQSMETLETYRKYYSAASAIADHVFLGRLDKAHSFSFDANLLPQPFPAPALILAGRFDPWCGYREAYKLLDNYPRATFAVLDRAGHGLVMEQKPLFQALAGEWLDRVEEYKNR